MSRRGKQQNPMGQIQTQAEVQEALTQLDHATSSQLTNTGDFNSQSREHDDNDNKNKTVPTLDKGDDDMMLSRFDDALQSYEFIHENEIPEGKRSWAATRKKKFREIMEMHHNLSLDGGPVGNYIINSPVLTDAVAVEICFSARINGQCFISAFI